MILRAKLKKHAFLFVLPPSDETGTAFVPVYADAAAAVELGADDEPDEGSEVKL